MRKEWIVCAAAILLVVVLGGVGMIRNNRKIGALTKQVEALGGQVGAAQAVPDVVRAHKFEVLDEKGKPCGMWIGGDADTTTQLWLSDENGNMAMLYAGEHGPELILNEATETGPARTRVMLGLREDGPALWLYDKHSKGRAVLDVDVLGMGNLRFADEDGKVCARLSGGGQVGTAFKLGPSLGLTDEKGHPGVSLAVDKNRRGLYIGDEKGALRARIEVDNDFTSLCLLDESFNHRASLVLTEDGPSLRLYDEKGKGRATLGTARTVALDGKRTVHPESSLLLFNEKGNVIWRTP